MKNKELLKTNFLICIVLVIGFLITAVFSYSSNYQSSLDDIEHVSGLTTEGIYYQLTMMFSKPVNTSLTMAHDSLLVKHLLEESQNLEDEEYVLTIRDYLETYRKKYDFDSVFLVSAATRRYYNFNGVDRVLTEDNPENTWYFDLMNSGLEYQMNVDNDEVDGADNAITVFVNCKIFDEDGNVLGVVGVGIRINYLKDFLKEYEEKYNLSACLIDEKGIIEISTSYTGYEKTDWFEAFGQNRLREKVLGWREETSNLELWSDMDVSGQEKSYVATRYIPELSWHLVVERNTGNIVRQLRLRLYQTGFVILAIITIVLTIITLVIRNFNRQIMELMEERQSMFHKATEQLYDNIYELNITRNCYVGKRTEQYFESLGAKGLPYDQGLCVIAEKQIREDFRDGYVSTFSPRNAIREYESGNDHLRYDFMITQDNENYHWMRIDAYIFYSHEDNCIHMFTYRKNIQEEKLKELQATRDEMTHLLTKAETERRIRSLLSAQPQNTFAFFIFDIDSFKQANDRFGHAFGDYCIMEFVRIMRASFREGDLLGRIGGDEFAAFIPVPDADWAETKAGELLQALDTTCVKENSIWKMSASIGVAIAPRDGTDFDTLYRLADEALYRVKRSGKKGFSVYEKT